MHALEWPIVISDMRRIVQVLKIIDKVDARVSPVQPGEVELVRGAFNYVALGCAPYRLEI
ncbi:hypothetical protein ASE96_04440 [Arthrobacter sp. Leaf69]|nr:hypothetical protein ASE96_04440 [Arthrobacter sp. Leaf69]